MNTTPNMPYVVAELSCSHTGSLQRARDLVTAAAAAGANAIKLQTWTPDTMVVDPSAVIESGPWAGRNMMEMYRDAHTPWEWHAELFELAKSFGMVGFSSVFDLRALEFLESIGCPMYKIASFELVDLELISEVAAIGKPMIISTGMATRDEIDDAISVVLGSGLELNQLTVLLCASAYPAAASDYRLLGHVRSSTEYSLGISDHTRGHALALAAQALGFEMIEKHIGFADGLDSAFASSPAEFQEMVTLMRHVAPSLDKTAAVDGTTQSEMPQHALRRSLYTRGALRKGERIPEDYIITARPANGAPCCSKSAFTGKVAKTYIPAGAPLWLADFGD